MWYLHSAPKMTRKNDGLLKLVKNYRWGSSSRHAPLFATFPRIPVEEGRDTEETMRSISAAAAAIWDDGSRKQKLQSSDAVAGEFRDLRCRSRPPRVTVQPPPSYFHIPTTLCGALIFLTPSRSPSHQTQGRSGPVTLRSGTGTSTTNHCIITLNAPHR